MSFRVARREARGARFGFREWGIRILAVGIVVVSAALIIGRHFDAGWAGGEGYRSSSIVIVDLVSGNEATCVGSDLTRESIVTCADQRKQITFGVSTLWLDGRTDFAIADRREGKEMLASHGGRSIIKGPVVIHIGEIELTTSGTMSIVDYSWLQKAEVYAVDGVATMKRGDETLSVPSGTAVRFDTAAPYEPAEAIDYSFESGAAADFYAWAKVGGGY